jgi:hypothetical protein
MWWCIIGGSISWGLPVAKHKYHIDPSNGFFLDILHALYKCRFMHLEPIVYCIARYYCLDAWLIISAMVIYLFGDTKCLFPAGDHMPMTLCPIHGHVRSFVSRLPPTLTIFR